MPIYALLVGIDAYVPPVGPLRGACNDIRATAAFLEGNFSSADCSVLCLTDADATRAAVIDGFRRHLGQAGPGDSALFWFSGHGSQAPVPAELARLEPTGTLQTILCADSRQDGVPDLYDKELAVLIGEIAARDVHVVAVMDCCHSDSATVEATNIPSLTARWEPAATTPTPVTLLLEGVLDRPEREVRPDSAVLGAVAADHVELAACQTHEAAYETGTPAGPRGLFSLELLGQLAALGPGATYRELMTGTRCGVENSVPGQLPVLSPTAESIVDQPFLGGRVTPLRSAVTMRCLDGVWEIDAGACHGMMAGTPEDPPLVAVHRTDPPLEARIVKVLADRSLVEPVGWTPVPGSVYPVVLTSVPLPVGTVALGGAPEDDARTTALVEAALRVAAPGGRPSPYVRSVDLRDPGQPPESRLSAPRPGRVTIGGADRSPLVADLPCSSPDDAARVVRR